MRLVRKVVIGVVGVVLVAALAVGGFMWWQLRDGTPDLPAELEALRAEAESVGEARPFPVGEGWRAAVTSVETSGARVQVWPEDESETPEGAFLKVGTSASVGSCTVALLETHPGRSGSAPGSQTGSVLVHISCPPRPSATETATPAPSGTATARPSATPTAGATGSAPATGATSEETAD